MKSRFSRLMAVLLAFVIAWFPMHPATAGMIGTGTVLAAAQQSADRDRVRQFFSRDAVKESMQSLGVSANAASERVDRLSEAEVQHIARHIGSAPAGADGGLIVIILLGILIWFLVLK